MQYLIINQKDADLIRRILDSALVTDTDNDGSKESNPTPPAQGTPETVVQKPFDSGFKFGKASEKELVGVNVDLVRVTRLALKYSTQDFVVFDGLRTYEEQALHVKNGTSRTMQSKHLQGLAVDLVPYIDGKPTWNWAGCYKIAFAMDRAATELGVAHRITWGAAWDRKLSDFGGSADAYLKEAQAYATRHPGKDFLDGPHFEILPA